MYFRSLCEDTDSEIEWSNSNSKRIYFFLKKKYIVSPHPSQFLLLSTFYYFNTPRKAFLIKSVREAFFVWLERFY